ncbi:hypothetical protein P8452_35497 [Trifolium repens]|nr:hypothetical protein P8452_35497 [Trifolium repens]
MDAKVSRKILCARFEKPSTIFTNMSTSNDNNVVSKIIGTVLEYTPFTNTDTKLLRRTHLPIFEALTQYYIVVWKLKNLT